MKRILSIALIVIPMIMTQAASAQIAASAQQDRQSPRELFENYNDVRTSEKVFVHTDKDSYVGGDTLWFRAYRVQAETHSPMLYSGLVYADLFDADNKQVARIQLTRTDFCFKGSYKLPKNLDPGYYTLTAYTYWMQNFPSEFYFSKRIYIHNYNDIAIKSEIEFLPDYKKRKVSANIKFAMSNGQPFRKTLFYVQYFKNGKNTDYSIKWSDNDGLISITMPMKDSITDLNVSFKDNTPTKYGRNFKVPIFDENIDVQFMPEGGHLLDGVAQHVAFKAIGADGKSVEVSGNVTDSKGNVIADIASVHKGMGEFLIQPKLGEKYTAKLSTADGRGTSVELPSVAAEGIGLMVSSKPDTLTYSVFSTEGFDYTGMNLAVQCRGKILMWQPIAGPGKNRLSPRMMPEGLLHFFIVDDNGKVYSERLALVNRDDNAKMAIKGLKTSYTQRELVEAEIDISELSENQTAELSVSVTDSQRAFSIPSDNIVSYLLLSSDIKGTIEEPWYYFDTNIDAAKRAYHAQLLLMTQGWKRFDLASVFSGEIPSMKYKIENAQSISGKVTKLVNEKKQLSNPVLTLFAPNLHKLRRTWIVEPDSAGNFTVNNMDFPNKTTFYIQGVEQKEIAGKANKTREKKKSMDIEVFEQQFEPYTPTLLDREIYRPETGMKTGTKEYEIARNFFSPKTARYIHNVNGERVLLLSPAEIVAKQVYAEDNGDTPLLLRTTPDEILESGLYFNLRDWLKAQPGIEIIDDPYDASGAYLNAMRKNKNNHDKIDPDVNFGTDNREAVYLNNGRVRLSVSGDTYRMSRNDGRQLWTWEILNMPLSAIKNIDMRINHRGSQTAATSYERSEYDINIRTHNLSGIFTENTPYKLTFTVLGYNQPMEFYKPVYGRANDDPAPDTRVTVYWEPNIIIGSTGKAKISFYMNDVPSDYTMTVHGITAAGKPFSKQVALNVRDKY